MEVLQILILSIIQGLTEFLPISSSAHLIISSSILGQETQSITVDIFAHGGSLFAVIIYFRAELANALKVAINNKDLRQKYGFHAEKQFLQSFLGEKVFRKFMNTISI